MSTQEIMALSREFDTIIDMVSNATPEKVERQVAIIKAEIDEVKEGIFRYDYEEIRDGCLDVIKTLMGMMILTDITPSFCEPPRFVSEYSVANKTTAWKLIKETEEKVSKMYESWKNPQQVLRNGVVVLVGVDTLSNLCESCLGNIYRICEFYGIDVLGDYKKMHEGLMSRFDTSEHNAAATVKHYLDTYNAKLYTVPVVLNGVRTLYVNKLKESTVLKPGGSLEPENKTMKSVFFNEPNYAGSRSKPPQNMRQLRPITREELCQMVDGKVAYIHLEGTTTTIATCEVVPGFVITGTSGTLSPRKYDVSLGETFAYDDIIDQLWRLEGYARQRMRYLRVGLSDHLDYGY